jgi:hypothetical protein
LRPLYANCSAWSGNQTAHTVLPAPIDKINIYLRGSGKNAPNYTIIEVNKVTVYYRRDQTGLILAVFSRLDFSLRWIKKYNTHYDRDQSLAMSRAIRQFNASFFVMVVSSIAWEWHASRTLVKTMEFCGAYHFGQWASIFAEQSHYESPVSDLQQSASQDEFGHPYAFIGIPGIGTGQGWESLLYNTGHYLAGEDVVVPKALIRAVAYYDYVARIYRLQDVEVARAGFYYHGRVPVYGSIHNPVPKAPNPYPLIPEMTAFNPYVGTLSKHITSIIEANDTVPPYQYAFAVFTVAGVYQADPRPKENGPQSWRCSGALRVHGTFQRMA